MMQKRPKRKDLTPLKVYCLPKERHQLQANAKATGLSLSVYLRRVGTGYQVQSLLDHDCMLDLVKANDDLNRLGRLLKLWLAHDPRTSNISSTTLRALVTKIENLQDEMRTILKKIVRL